MSTIDMMAGTVQAYFDRFNAADGAGLAALFADDAQIYDPVGSPAKTGKDEIKAFYEMATRSGTQIEQSGTTRLADRSAAFSFRVHVQSLKPENKAVDVDLPTGPMTIDVIDVFDFDEAGKIKTMRAYWGPSNISS